MLIVQNKKSPYVYERLKKAVQYHFNIEEYTEFHEQRITNRYRQDIEVDLISEYSKSAFVFKLITSNQQYELAPSLKKQEALIRQLTSITEKVELGVNTSGDIERLINHDEIKEKWNLLSPKLKRTHQGVLAHGYLDAIAEKIADKKRFIADLKQYRLFGMLFNSLLRIPFDDKTTQTRLRTFNNIIHCLPVSILEQLTLVSEDVVTSQLTYAVTGTLQPIDDDTKSRIEKYLKYYEAGEEAVYLESYTGNYVINKYTAWTKSAYISITLSNGRGYRRYMQFTLEKQDL
ncbi:hypothetical protein [Tamlana sp. I1]|uniref:hypothetical protein n=1 Tax=Tamlana sp. I1 TaxID=2762061 RepID=UPI00188E1AD2|nr:hypothetical protein [Tamlana sp. I1]